VQFRSTRSDDGLTLDDALVRGIASDGGLFLPELLPKFTPADFADAENVLEVAERLLGPFFAGSTLSGALREIVKETFHFPLPVSRVTKADGYLGMLELFHGPTAAFKDVGAGFLAACLGRLVADADNPLTILVATSGDTGGAVAAAFDGRPGMRVVVLYPDGRVSARQAQQLTCWGDNVLSLAVQGSFDDCQALVKAMLADAALARRFRFSSANSINIGRLLPQSIYYADASLRHYRRTGRRPGFIVPTGNLGNGLACCLAREFGLPIGPIVLATNANRLVPDFLAGAEWQPRDSIQTHASAMDVGNPSNMERLRYLFGDAAGLARVVSAVAVDDAAIEAEIRQNFSEFGLITCPHTATATHAWRQLPPSRHKNEDWIAVATAHPAKFETIVEPLIGETVPLPPELQRILSREQRFEKVAPDLAAVAGALDARFGG